MILILFMVAVGLVLSGCKLQSKRSRHAKSPPKSMVLPTGSYQFFSARLEDARWEASSDPLLCILSHEIPEYGRATFSQKPKQGMYFSIRVKRAPKAETSAVLLSKPPPWRHHDNTLEMGLVPVVASQTPFYFNNGWARQLLDELRQGMMPVLIYRDWSDGKDEVSVRISSINFHAAWQEFENCQQSLLPYSFSDVRKSVFQFGVNKVRLDSLARQRLDQLVEYVMKDPAVRIIKVDGYTDSKGFSRININVARRRAESVKQYLVAHGVSAARIKTEGHHEKVAKFSNRTQKGRNKNRRVEITLIR